MECTLKVEGNENPCILQHLTVAFMISILDLVKDNISEMSWNKRTSYPVGTGGAFSRRVKRSAREAGNSPPSGAEIKNGGGGAIHPLPYVFKA
jgi:hypothetical protein